MNQKNAADRLDRFAEACIQCGVCLNTCALLQDLGLTAGEIAEQVFNGPVSDELLAAIQRCDLCGRCSEGCLVNLNPPEMFKAAREYLIQTGRINPNDYDVMLVDRDWNFFSIYRETYGIRYDDLPVEGCEALFFPGCTLAAYAPELTRAAFSWLKEQGLQVGFADLCCGKPLDSIGLCAEADRYLDHLRALLKKTGARQIITACPNCEAHLCAAHLCAAQLPKIEIRSIYALLVEAGVRLSGSERLTFHDSCPDRYRGKNPRDVRALLAGYTQVEMASRGKETICCGSGGIVSMVDPDLCAARGQRRLAEFAASGADTCVTSCMACSHRLARAGQPTGVRHCLEYVFGIPIDYAQVGQNTQAMWEGSQGELNLQRLAQAQILPLRE